MADGSVFLQYHDREHNIKMIILIIFADVNIVVKKMLTIGMICGMNIIIADYKMKKKEMLNYKKRSSVYSRT